MRPGYDWITFRYRAPDGLVHWQEITEAALRRRSQKNGKYFVIPQICSAYGDGLCNFVHATRVPDSTMITCMQCTLSGPKYW